jgi:hypothetical protein
MSCDSTKTTRRSSISASSAGATTTGINVITPFQILVMFYSNSHKLKGKGITKILIGLGGTKENFLIS